MSLLETVSLGLGLIIVYLIFFPETLCSLGIHCYHKRLNYKYCCRCVKKKSI